MPLHSFAQDAEIFVSWDDFEPDKCASIWLIKRFIAPNSEIKIVPKGTAIQTGIAFDTPEAKLRRYHNRSTFETLVSEYKLNDQKLLHLGKMMHDIEINTWARKAFEESNQIKADIMAIIAASESPDEIIEKSIVYFDRYS